MNFEKYRTDICAFADDFIGKTELGKPFRLMDHQREILELAFDFNEEGRLWWDTLIYSCPKKSGKTFLNALITTWWAFTQEAPNEIYVCANDLEQAQSRVFKAIIGTIRNNPKLTRSADIGAKQITLSNGTTIVALAGDYAGSAGSNHGLVSYDEPWAIVHEESIRMWEELTPVPTRQNSVKVCSSYAGWQSESSLLEGIYKQGVGIEEHPDGQGERMHPELPVYANRESRLLVYWDHLPRMPWQTPEYYKAQKRSLRPGAYLRLHENRWGVAEDTFITPELWDGCVDHEHSRLLPTPYDSSYKRQAVYVGIDAGIKSDHAAEVGVYWDGPKLALAFHRLWKPSREAPLDIENTLEEYTREIQHGYNVRAVLCDPYQMHRSITSLKAERIPIEEYPQTSPNCTQMGQVLFDLLNGKGIRLYESEELKQQALNTVAVESPRGFRIAKEKTSKKIDAIVALAMACVAALEKPKASHDWSRIALGAANQLGYTPGKYSMGGRERYGAAKYTVN